MKIIIDNAIPFLNSLFEPYAEVIYIAGNQFTPALVRDADALIIRTRTICDATLLEGSSVSIIATATIGCDHIDLEYCRRNNIKVTNAAGCNARAVLQWVGGSLAHLSKIEGWRPNKKTIGVIGVGNVGSLVAKYCNEWGFKVLCCDPPRAIHEEGFIELEELLTKADIITLHTPLNETSHHLINSNNIKLLHPSASILNASRGECLETLAIEGNHAHKLCIDVWENEPNIDLEILQRAVVSTPHIAGYSLQGKANGSSMAAHSVAEHLGIPIQGWYPDVKKSLGCSISWDEMVNTIGDYFNVQEESETLKSRAKEFEWLRNNYSYREEYF